MTLRQSHNQHVHLHANLDFNDEKQSNSGNNNTIIIFSTTLDSHTCVYLKRQAEFAIIGLKDDVATVINQDC